MTPPKRDKATDDTPDAPQQPENSPADVPTPDSAPQADLANVTPQTEGVSGATGTPIDGEINEAPIVELKALGNANPDVNVTAVRNAHGTWTWTARAADDGRELARSPHPHFENQLVENLTLLFSGSTVALHRTGDDKVRKLA